MKFTTAYFARMFALNILRKATRVLWYMQDKLERSIYYITFVMKFTVCIVIHIREDYFIKDVIYLGKVFEILWLCRRRDWLVAFADFHRDLWEANGNVLDMLDHFIKNDHFHFLFHKIFRNWIIWFRLSYISVQQFFTKGDTYFRPASTAGGIWRWQLRPGPKPHIFEFIVRPALSHVGYC